MECVIRKNTETDKISGTFAEIHKSYLSFMCKLEIFDMRRLSMSCQPLCMRAAVPRPRRQSLEVFHRHQYSIGE